MGGYLSLDLCIFRNIHDNESLHFKHNTIFTHLEFFLRVVYGKVYMKLSLQFLCKIGGGWGCMYYETLTNVGLLTRTGWVYLAVTESCEHLLSSGKVQK